MSYELKRGQALVITGPQGCGKTQLARKIAEQHGSFVEVEAAQLDDHHGISEALANKPATLIVDGLPTQNAVIEKIKAMITSGSVRVNRKHQVAEIVETPNFIFCSGEANPFLLAGVDRRFQVVRLASTTMDAEQVTPQQLSIALAKLYSGCAPGDDMWCELDYRALEHALGHPVERKPTQFAAPVPDE